MKFICDAPDRKAWFRIETELEAQQESELMQHAVEKYFRREREKAAQSYQPSPATSYIERDIGLEDHIQRQMPSFLTLRDAEGNGLATGMLPPDGSRTAGFHIIIVGRANRDPYPSEGAAIEALAKRFGLTLDRQSCFPLRVTNWAFWLVCIADPCCQVNHQTKHILRRRWPKPPAVE